MAVRPACEDALIADPVAAYKRSLVFHELLPEARELELGAELASTRRALITICCRFRCTNERALTLFNELSTGERYIKGVLNYWVKDIKEKMRLLKIVQENARMLPSLLGEDRRLLEQVIEPKRPKQERLSAWEAIKEVRSRQAELIERARLCPEFFFELLPSLKAFSARCTQLIGDACAEDQEKRAAARSGLQALLHQTGLMPTALAKVGKSLAATEERYLRARKTMAEGNLRLVISIAAERRYQGRGISPEDLLQEGNCGLMRAIDRFAGGTFSTYATAWITEALESALRDKSRTIRVSAGHHKALRSIPALEHRLKQDLGRNINPSEFEDALGEKLQLSRKIVLRLLSCKSIASLDVPPAGLNAPADCHDAAAAPAVNDDDKEEWLNAVRSALGEVLRSLPFRERETLMRYGLNGRPEETQAAVGKRLGMSGANVGIIERRLRERLRVTLAPILARIEGEVV